MKSKRVVKIETVAGNVGYRHQLDRVRRFLERAESIDQSDVDFQDMIWAFFQNCYHLRDWVANDPLLSAAQVDAIIKKVGESRPLQQCGFLCNGTKHLATKPARHSHIAMTIEPGTNNFSSMDCMIAAGDDVISGKELARACLAEWERIFHSEGLGLRD